MRTSTRSVLTGFLAAGLLLAAAGCGGTASDQNESGASGPGENNFAYLINKYTESTSNPIPWAGYWWPYTANGIASGKYGSGSSPAGKYDAARGRKSNASNSAQAWEIGNHGSKVPKVQQWWGHCNGWCAASAMFPEPHEDIRVNGITFTVADQKALLTEASMESDADFFGERMENDDMNSPKYRDSPDQYFLVLTNYLGKLKKPVLIDRYTGYEVWNQPLAGYRCKKPVPADYLGGDGGVYKINVTCSIWWREDGVLPDVQTPQFDWTQNFATTERELKMEVWLDGPVTFNGDTIATSGNVIVTAGSDGIARGGAWKMGEGYNVHAWPDYMWVPFSVATPTDYGNPNVDVEWLRKWMLTPGSYNTGENALPVDHAPEPEPSSTPHPNPTAPIPNPFPTHPPH